MIDNTIPKIEVDIYKKLDFTNEISRIRLRYNKNDNEIKFKSNEVKALMKTIGLPYNYGGENSHELTLKVYNNFTFKISFNILYNYVVHPFFTISKNNKYFGPKITNLFWLLNEISYDESLLNSNFGLNSMEDLKKYITDFIKLCNKFTDEYIKEIEAGNVPE